VLLIEHLHDVVPVDDLGMMIHAENARHAIGRAGELDHRRAVAGLVLAREDARSRGALGDEIEQAVVDDAEVAAVAQFAGELAEPRMRGTTRREHVLGHPTAFLGAKLDACRARPAAHQAKAVAYAEEHCGIVRSDVVEQSE
jgi:hypothetical protein